MNIKNKKIFINKLNIYTNIELIHLDVLEK